MAFSSWHLRCIYCLYQLACFWSLILPSVRDCCCFSNVGCTTWPVLCPTDLLEEVQHLITTFYQIESWDWAEAELGHRVIVKITYGSKTFASNTDTFVFSLCYKLKLACCLENGECVPLETCVLSLLLCAFAVWHLENIGKTGHAPMPDKQNTKYISYSSSSIKVRIIKKSISWRGKCQKRKYNCSGSFPFPDFKVFVKSVVGWSINYWGWSIIGADTFQICAHMISPICRWYLWPHPLKAIDDMQSY